MSDFYFPMSSFDPHNLQKLRRKRSKVIKILLPKPPHCGIMKPPHSQSRHCCPECFKNFGSQKALYGQMRCHPDRDYRGMIRKPNYPSSSSNYALIKPQSSSTALMSMEDHEIASCLLMLTRTATFETDGCNVGWAAEAEASSFECSSYKKVFGSHQALGGHRASHKNVKGCFAVNRSCDTSDDNHDHHNTSDNPDEESKEMVMVNNLGHKCSICFRVFPSGQALGGHKRCHWEKGEDEDGNNGRFCGLMDLNIPADFSAAAAAADFCLDLRLGL